MIVESCATRLKKALAARNVKPAELSRRTNISRGMISEYLKGLYEPKQDKVYLIAQALNISEAWLMGFDVPMEPQARNDAPSPDELQLTEGEQMLIDLFRRVPEDQQQLVLQMILAALGSRG